METQIELVDENPKDLNLPLLLDGRLEAFFNGEGSMLRMTRINRDELGAKEWHYGHSHQVGSEQGQDNSKRQRGKKIFAYSEEKDNREEDDRRTESSGQNRKLYLFAALDSCFRWRFAHFHMPEDVFENDNRVVD